MNHHRSLKSSPKPKRQSIDRHSRDKDNNNSNLGPNRSKRPRHSLEDTCVPDRAIKAEMVESSMTLFKNPSPKPVPFPAHSNHPSTTPVPLLDTSGLIRFDTEVDQFDAVLGDAGPLNTSVTQEQQISATDVDASAATQHPRPLRRMFFKPVLRIRRNQPTISSVQDPTFLASDSAKPPSANPESDDKPDRPSMSLPTISQKSIHMGSDDEETPSPNPPSMVADKCINVDSNKESNQTLPIQQSSISAVAESWINIASDEESERPRISESVADKSINMTSDEESEGSEVSESVAEKWVKLTEFEQQRILDLIAKKRINMTSDEESISADDGADIIGISESVSAHKISENHIADNRTSPAQQHTKAEDEPSADSKRDRTSQPDYVPVQEKTTSPCPRPHLPSPRPRPLTHGPSQSQPSPIPQPLHTVAQESSTEGVSESCPPPLSPPQPPRDSRIVDEVEVQEMKASLLKDEDYGSTTDPDTEVVVDLLLHDTPEESNNRLSNSCQELHTSHTDEQDKEPSVLAEEDTSVIEMLAAQFIQRSANPFLFLLKERVRSDCLFFFLFPGIYNYSMWTV